MLNINYNFRRLGLIRGPLVLEVTTTLPTLPRHCPVLKYPIIVLMTAPFLFSCTSAENIQYI